MQAWWIHCKIQNFLAKNYSLIKPPSGTKARLIFSLLKSSKISQALDEMQDGGDVDMSDILPLKAIEAGITLAMLLAAREKFKPEMQLEEMRRGDDGEHEKSSWEQTFGDGVDNESRWIFGIDRAVIERVIECLRSTLSDKERFILEHRILNEDEPMTLQEIGDKFDISRERIRQIEAKTREKLRNALSNGGCKCYVQT